MPQCVQYTYCCTSLSFPDTLVTGSGGVVGVAAFAASGMRESASATVAFLPGR